MSVKSSKLWRCTELMWFCLVRETVWDMYRCVKGWRVYALQVSTQMTVRLRSSCSTCWLCFVFTVALDTSESSVRCTSTRHGIYLS